MSMLSIADKSGRDATVSASSLKAPQGARRGLVGQKTECVRYMSCAASGLHESLQAKHGEDYARALIDGDPEIDMSVAGKRIGATSRAFMTEGGELLQFAPAELDIIIDATGAEVSREPAVRVKPNVSADTPAQWTGKRMNKRDVVRRFVLSRTISLSHVDGLTYEYLHGMASDLAASGDMMIMGAGGGGREALILASGGCRYRGFLEGRVDGLAYCLLLHLSNMELKAPGKV